LLLFESFSDKNYFIGLAILLKVGEIKLNFDENRISSRSLEVDTSDAVDVVVFDIIIIIFIFIIIFIIVVVVDDAVGVCCCCCKGF